MDSAASEWNPLAQVRVYSDSQNTQISTIDSGAIRVTVGSLGSLSSSGVYTESANDAVITTDFSLTKNADGQWRIVSLEDGILFSEHLFDQLYVKSPLYFLSTDSSALVADLRWYPRKTFATNAVDGLLAGPSQWLAGGVHTAFPSGTSRAMAVDVTNGVATVDLSTEVLAASDAEQTLLATQLQRTLTASTDIQSVQITVAGAPLGADANADLSAYPFGSFSLSVLADGLPAQVSGGSAVPMIDNPALPEADLSDLAVGYDADQTQYAALANGGRTSCGSTRAVLSRIRSIPGSCLSGRRSMPSAGCGRARRRTVAPWSFWRTTAPWRSCKPDGLVGSMCVISRFHVRGRASSSCAMWAGKQRSMSHQSLAMARACRQRWAIL
ncbi:hypothetical protein DDD63_03455 [Actinobaculum sp. 313]|nr:hypothetical protein DDD63_03455 [Actinobaculum sp. 313]